MVKIIETPRDGFQGLPYIIETKKKIEYTNLLLKCGFHTVEVGSFVSPKIIPQMADTAKVLNGIDLSETKSEIAVLVATEGGAKQAVTFGQVDQIFYPFSISSEFLKRNINRTLEEAVVSITNIQNLCVQHGKQLVIFFSMGFGNPYKNDTNWSIDTLSKYIDIFMNMGITVFPFSDIFGESTPKVISNVFKSLIIEFPKAEFGFHLHSLAEQSNEKVDAAYNAGIRRFDTVLNGLGGCPQTGKELVGNLPLGELTNYLDQNDVVTGISSKNVEMAKQYLINEIQNSIYS